MQDRILAGEVSLVDGDNAVNRSYGPVGRFFGIEEGEPPICLLVTDYPKYHKFDKL